MADIKSLMEKSWAIRASDPLTPTLKVRGKSPHMDDDATVQTMNSEYKGKEILYPTIRMVDGELKKFDEKTAKEIAIEKGDYVEYNSIEEAEKASKDLSDHIGNERRKWEEFTENPKGFMEEEEKKRQEYLKNMSLGTPIDFYSGVMAKPINTETKMEIWGSDFRNYLEFNRTSIPFMKVYDYFNPEKRED